LPARSRLGSCRALALIPSSAARCKALVVVQCLVDYDGQMESTSHELVDESARRRFEAAWQNGRPESIDMFLPSSNDPSFLATLVELVLIDMEMAWKALHSGQNTLASGASCRGPLVETYALRFPPLNEPGILLRLLREENRLRQRYGDPPSPTEYESRFPSLAEEMCSLVMTVRPASGPRNELAAPEIPGYELLSTLGRGGMGVVYTARQLSLKRIVALKMIRAAQVDGEERARFRTEAEAVARLQHPNIVHIFEVGESQGRPYFSLEYVDGGSLDRRIAGVPQPPHVAARLVECLARAVQYAHDNGLIHRDLKPSNVLLHASEPSSSPNGVRTPGLSDTTEALDLSSSSLKITDFGLAKRLTPGDSAEALTQSGAVLGTPSDMAPEQAAGKKEVGPAADIYALGAILYELITGRPPFRGANSVETIVQVLQEEPVPPSRLQPKLPRDLETICMKCLEKESRKRYVSAAALADDLDRYQRGQPILARPTGFGQRLAKWARRQPVVATLIMLLIVVFAGGLAGVLWQWRQAESNRAQEARARASAEASLNFHRLALADREWWDANVVASNRLLDECPPGLREWEWRLLHFRCNSELTRIDLPGQALAFSPDGKRLAVQAGGAVHVLNASDGSKLRSFESSKTLQARRIAFRPDGQQLAGCGHPGLVVLWDVATGKEVQRFLGRKDAFSVAFSADGSYLACGGGVRGDGELRLWRLADHKDPRVWSRFDYPVDYLAFPRDGGWFASGAWNSKVQIWDLASEKPIREIPENVHGLAASPDGRFLATASVDTTIRIWDVATGQVARKLAGNKSKVTCLAFAADGQRLVSGSTDATVRLWNWRTETLLAVFRGHAGQIHDVAFSPDGGRIASTAENVRIWDAAMTQEGQCFARHVQAFAFHADGKALATSSHGNHALTLWDLQTGTPITTFGDHAAPVVCLAFAAERDLLASASTDGTVKIWDNRSRHLQRS